MIVDLFDAVDVKDLGGDVAVTRVLGYRSVTA